MSFHDRVTTEQDINPSTEEKQDAIIAAINNISWWSPLTTKWDLYTFDTANTRLWVWTDNQILIADSNEATWLKWVDSIAWNTTKAMTFVVTTAFVSWEVIDITNGNWSISWVATRTIWSTWSIDDLWSSASVFNSDPSLSITEQRTVPLKWTDVSWESSTSISFARNMAVWEFFIINQWETASWWDLWNTTIDWDLTVTGSINKTWGSVWTEITFVDDSASSSTINLPTAVGLLNVRKTFIRTDISLHTTTIVANWSEKINNVSNFILSNWESITLISDNSNWFII